MGDIEDKEDQMVLWLKNIQTAICPVVCTKCKLVSETREMIDKQCRIYDGMRGPVRKQMEMTIAARPMFMNVEVICGECSHTGYIKIKNPLKRM